MDLQSRQFGGAGPRRQPDLGMRLYRVEHPDTKKGPFWHGVTRKVPDFHRPYKGGPLGIGFTDADGIPLHGAVVSPDQLFMWFDDDDAINLEREGFKLATFDVPQEDVWVRESEAYFPRMAHHPARYEDPMAGFARLKAGDT